MNLESPGQDLAKKNYNWFLYSALKMISKRKIIFVLNNKNFGLVRGGHNFEFWADSPIGTNLLWCSFEREGEQ